jgi:ubiquitin carboxyl-terminal hydrolase 48
MVVNVDELKKWLGQGVDLPKQPPKSKDPEIEIIESPAAKDTAKLSESEKDAATPAASVDTPVEPPQAQADGTVEAALALRGSTDFDMEHNLSDADSARTLVSSPLPAGPSSLNTNFLQGTIRTDSLCEHGLIIPPASSLKRITTTAYTRLISLGVQFQPALAHTDVCPDCTERILTGDIKLYWHRGEF